MKRRWIPFAAVIAVVCAAATFAGVTLVQDTSSTTTPKSTMTSAVMDPNYTGWAIVTPADGADRAPAWTVSQHENKLGPDTRRWYRALVWVSAACTSDPCTKAWTFNEAGGWLIMRMSDLEETTDLGPGRYGVVKGKEAPSQVWDTTKKSWVESTRTGSVYQAYFDSSKTKVMTWSRATSDWRLMNSADVMERDTSMNRVTRCC